jgi:hypothetical protein
MIENPVRSFSSITVSAFELDIGALWRGFEHVFAEFRIDTSHREGPIAYERYGLEPAPGAVGRRRGALLPVLTPEAREATLMITNMIDGWTTLATRASTELRCRCWQFTVCRDVPHPRNAFQRMDAGVIRRLVSVMRDSTRWEFVERGAPLSIESAATYSARRVKDRLTREHVLTIAAEAGFAIGEDATWRSNGIAFEERRT